MDIDRAIGETLERTGVSIDDAKVGVVTHSRRITEKDHARSGEAETFPRKQEQIRVLVADDQPHILEAVELLLAPRASMWTACARRSCCWKRSARATTTSC